MRLVGVVNAALGGMLLSRALAWTGTMDLLTYGLAIAAVSIALTYFMAAHAAKHRGGHGPQSAAWYRMVWRAHIVERL